MMCNFRHRFPNNQTLIYSFVFYLVIAIGLTFCICACNSSTRSEGNSSGLTAKVDGKAWEATPISIVAQTNAGIPGSLMILGSQANGNKTLSLTMTIYNVGGLGKYAFGVSITGFGGTGLVGEGTGVGGDANSWITPGNGTAGILELTSISDGRIKGTFSYNVIPGHSNKVGGNRLVTEGKFDLPLTGTISALAENMGSQISAELNGVYYNAENTLGQLKDFTGEPGILISSTTDSNGISLNLVGVTNPGTYSLSNLAPLRSISVGRNGGTAANCCWGVMTGDIGEIVVTSITAKRVQGTFSGTLKPRTGKPATQDLVITKGLFSIGIK
jgi:uncharacterized membrane protein